VIDLLGSPHDVRELTEEFRFGIGFVRSVILARAFHAGPIAGPGLHFGIAGLDEQGVFGPAIGPQQRDGVRVVEARQVPEVAVLAKWILGVARARNHARAPEDRNRVGAHRVAHPLSSLFEHPLILTRI
jgi:hypothetical protein